MDTTTHAGPATEDYRVAAQAFGVIGIALGIVGVTVMVWQLHAPSIAFMAASLVFAALSWSAHRTAGRITIPTSAPTAGGVRR